MRQCLLSFSAESFVSQFAVQKYKELDIRTYIFIYFFLCVYACDTWSLTLSEQIKLRLFENAV